MRVPRLFWIFCLSGLLSSSQSPPPVPVSPADPVIRVSVNLVQIDAVVTDSKGRHITGLGPEDFQVFEDGKPQKITHLSYIDAQSAPAPPSAASSTPRKSGVPESIVVAPSRKPRQDEIHRAMVFLVDDLHTSPEDLIQLKPVAKKFVDEQVAPGDLVSISAVRGGMGFYEQFTNDRSVLNAAVESLAKRVGGSSDPVDPADGAAGCLRALMLFDAVMGKLSWAIQSLNELPGRKAIVLFSDGLAIPRQACPSESQDMTSSMERIANQSNRSGVGIYAIDSRGLVTNQLTAGDRISGGGRAVAGALRARAAQSIALQETSDFLSAETGGLFFRNTNGLSEALGKSIGDMNGYYLIGFQPQRTDFELKNGSAVYHKVEVKLRARGLSVRYGRGFLGTADKDAGAPETPAQQLANALISPFDTGGIRVRLTPIYSAPVAGPNGERRPTVIKALLSIDGGEEGRHRRNRRGVPFRQHPDRHEGEPVHSVAQARGHIQGGEGIDVSDGHRALEVGGVPDSGRRPRCGDGQSGVGQCFRDRAGFQSSANHAFEPDAVGNRGRIAGFRRSHARIPSRRDCCIRVRGLRHERQRRIVDSRFPRRSGRI